MSYPQGRSPHNPTLLPSSPISNLNLDIVQTNLQHSQSATACLRRVLEMKPRTIALIQEPWIRCNRICGLSNIGGKLILNTQDTGKPRTCAFIPDDIPTTTLTQFCSRDQIAVRLATDGDAPDIVLASVYMPGEEEDCPPKMMSDLVRHCEDASLDLIICTDSNAHHPLWGCDKPNRRGKERRESRQQVRRHRLDGESNPVKLVMKSNLTFNLGDEFFAWKRQPELGEQIDELSIPSNDSKVHPSRDETKADSAKENSSSASDDD